jgi:hypothetical protein
LTVLIGIPINYKLVLYASNNQKLDAMMKS